MATAPKISVSQDGKLTAYIERDGTVISKCEVRGCDIVEMWTKLTYQGHGYGSAVLQRALSTMKNCPTVHVLAYPTSGQAVEKPSLHAFYKRHGFRHESAFSWSAWWREWLDGPSCHMYRVDPSIVRKMKWTE